MSRDRSDSSTASTFGLATVSIKAAVSPKSRMNSTGPAPGGRSRMPFRRRAMSSHSFPGSTVCSSTRMTTMDTLVRDVDSMRSTREFPAMRSSIRLVTSCSMRSALAPGHTAMAAA